MTQKAVIQFEVEKNKHRYTFVMPVGSPLGEAYDAVFEVLIKLKEISDEAVEKAKRVEEENGEAEETAVEE